MSKLTPAFVKTLAQPGTYQDGRGLFLRVSRTLSKRWVFRYMRAKKRHDLALGSYPALTLREARLEADRYRLQIARGADPAAERAQAKAVTTLRPPACHSFQSVAERYMHTHASAWSHKHQQQWRNTLGTHVYPRLGSLDVAEIDTEALLEVLTPIWRTLPVTAGRVRNRIELVLDAAKALGLRQGENPARWRGHLDKLLPRPGHSPQPFPCATPEQTAAWLALLDRTEGAAARACELAILTATRNQEVCGAQWDEFDWQTHTWQIPAHRMKTGKAHRVPLTEPMCAVLRQQQDQHPVWVFPNARRTGPLPGNALSRALARLKVSTAVPHGFRSTFRTWAAEHTNHPREVCERALAHSLGSKVEAAYNRGELLEKRRVLMQDWGEFLASQAPHNAGAAKIRNDKDPAIHTTVH